MTHSPTTILTSASTQATVNASTSLRPKRKRKPAGTPDPDAEIIALSPKMLMESDRYVCEICSQGFQRDQNLQMHRRRHKVPWKLLKRDNPEVRKRVYVCPEPSCLHHNPCHALGDVVGIKKHYRRKHSSMKQWECEKCSKAYAVQSDYKAHLKTCGTRGHCCDCGRVFSRVESFIEHRDTCTAASSKKGSVSSELEAVLSSHALPVEIGASPDSPLPINAHACNTAFPSKAPAPLPITPASPANAVQFPWHSLHSTAHSQATQVDDSILCETPQPCIPQKRLRLRHHKPELQLLITSKAHVNQLESSQSSVTWGRDMASTNSTTSGMCSSPASKPVNDKGALDCPEALPMSVTASTATGVPCKLQLSIGLSYTDHVRYDQKNTSPQVSSDVANQEAETSSMPLLASSAFPLDVNDALSIGVPKKQSSLCPSSDERPRSTCCIDAYDGGNDFELTTGFDPNCSALLLNQTGVDKVHQSQQRQGLFLCCGKSAAAEPAVEFSDQNSTKSIHTMVEDEEVLELVHVHQQSCKQLLYPKGAADSKLLRCNSVCESGIPLDISDQLQTEQSNSILGSISLEKSSRIREADHLSTELLQFAETLKFTSAAIAPHEKLSFSLGPDINAPTAAEVAEVLLQTAREELRRASAEKLEGEKAWRKARREREQAEEEYNRMIIANIGKGALMEKQEEGGATRKPTCSSSTRASIANSLQASSSSLQMKQLQAGGVLGSAPSFITCPTCHHTQILYRFPTNMATLLLASPVELVPADTLIGSPHIKVPLSPSGLS